MVGISILRRVLVIGWIGHVAAFYSVSPLEHIVSARALLRSLAGRDVRTMVLDSAVGRFLSTMDSDGAASIPIFCYPPMVEGCDVFVALCVLSTVAPFVVSGYDGRAVGRELSWLNPYVDSRFDRFVAYTRTRRFLRQCFLLLFFLFFKDVLPVV
jgi:hypothetical protein